MRFCTRLIANLLSTKCVINQYNILIIVFYQKYHLQRIKIISNTFRLNRELRLVILFCRSELEHISGSTLMKVAGKVRKEIPANAKLMYLIFPLDSLYVRIAKVQMWLKSRLIQISTLRELRGTSKLSSRHQASCLS